jgi:hypothetical protein
VEGDVIAKCPECRKKLIPTEEDYDGRQWYICLDCEIVVCIGKADAEEVKAMRR